VLNHERCHLQVTALQIASLKKVNKRTQILLLDKSGSTSKVIAKELSRKGFRKIRVIQVRPPCFIRQDTVVQSVLAGRHIVSMWEHPCVSCDPVCCQLAWTLRTAEA